MSDDLIEAAKSRDARFRLIDEGFAVGAEMRDSPTIRYLLRSVTLDADAAMEELAEVSPHDAVTIARLLVKVKTLVYMRKALLDVQQRAEMCAREIQAEDLAGLHDD